MRGRRIQIGRDKLNIRLANKDDVEELTNLRILQQHEDWETDYFDYDNNFYHRTFNAMTSFMSAPHGGVIFVGEIDGYIIATCGLQLINMLPQCNDDGKYGFIFNVFTKKEYRNRGIQSILIGKVIDYAIKNNISEIKLETDNDIAIKLYEKQGFKFDTLTMIKEMR